MIDEWFGKFKTYLDALFIHFSQFDLKEKPQKS